MYFKWTIMSHSLERRVLNKASYILHSIFKRDVFLTHMVERWFRFYIFPFCRVETDVSTTVFGKIRSNSMFEFTAGPKIKIKTEHAVGKRRNINNQNKSFRQRCVQVCVWFHSPWIATTWPSTLSPTSSACSKEMWAAELESTQRAMLLPQTLQFPLSSPSRGHQSGSLHIWNQNIPDLSTAGTDSCIWTLEDRHRLLEPRDVLAGLSHLSQMDLCWEVIAHTLVLLQQLCGLSARAGDGNNHAPYISAGDNKGRTAFYCCFPPRKHQQWPRQ